jgi:predicted nucleic acid-binding protein
MVLVDTSVWVEFFRPLPALSGDALASLDLLLEEDRAATVLPVEAEILSGKLDGRKRREVRDAFDAMKHIDPDWNARDVWKRVAEMSGIANRSSLPVPGIVDRMILVAAERAGASLWTLDGSLLKLAPLLNVGLFS